jgi:hypothetical protein
MSNWTLSIVPNDAQTLYLLVDDFGKHGLAWRETDVGDSDLGTIIRGMLDGEYSNPVRVVGFNTAEGWAHDVSEDVAHELRPSLRTSGYRCAGSSRTLYRSSRAPRSRSAPTCLKGGRCTKTNDLWKFFY